MHQISILLFAIPVVSILVIAILQVLDETFQKKFILERRAETSTGEQRRRHSDAISGWTAEEPDADIAHVATDLPAGHAKGI